MQVPSHQRRREKSADHMEKLRRQDDPRQPRQSLDVLRMGQAGRHEACEWSRKGHQRGDAHESPNRQEIGDDAEGAPSAPASSPRWQCERKIGMKTIDSAPAASR